MLCSWCSIKSDSKDLAKRNVSDKILNNRAHEIAMSPKYDGYQRALASMAYMFFDKKKKTGSGAAATSKARGTVRGMLAQELTKPVIKKLKRRKVYARFKNNILASDLAEMISLSFNHGIKYLVCVTEVFTKYVWVKTLNNKNAETVLQGFIEILNECKCKPNKLGVDKSRVFYNNLMQKWLDNKGVLMYSTHKEGKSIVSERFAKTLKVKSIQKWQLINNSKSYLDCLS